MTTITLTFLKLTFTALNSSRTAYASFSLEARAFFIDYQFQSNSQATGGERFTCQLLNKVGRLDVLLLAID
jgi:cell cycle checkpoint control protein RAD9A